jgi:hypothetical protein
MELRLITAYSLMFLIGLSIAGFIAFIVYNSPSQQRRRRLRRDAAGAARRVEAILAETPDRRPD